MKLVGQAGRQSVSLKLTIHNDRIKPQKRCNLQNLLHKLENE
jgi:hypothetical protein